MNQTLLGGLSVTLAMMLLTLGSDPAHGSGPQAASNQHHGAAMPASQLAALRGATARFHQLDVALSEGYAPFGGCFSDPGGTGGMGYHYVNGALISDPAIDPLRPELLVYQRLPNGQLHLAAVEWITFVSAWHDAGNADAPSLFNQEFHLNPTLLDEPFYLLHAWIWKNNPSGMFVDWNRNVHCD